MTSSYFLKSSRLGFRSWSSGDIELAIGLWGDPLVTKMIDSRGRLSRGNCASADILSRMPESLRTRFQRHAFNLFPAYRGTGARLTYIADDFREVRLRLPLNWRTRNYVGTIFGGSMFGAVDPIYMIMLIRNLGSRYVVWNKSASIRFRKPGKTTLYAKFVVTTGELAEIQAALETQEAIERIWTVDLADSDGSVCASSEQRIHIRRKRSG